MRFTTKEESNKRRQEEFLKLAPSKRVELFLQRSIQLAEIPSRHQKNANKGNFVLKLYDDE